VDPNALLGAMEEQIAASAGAACHSGQVHVSHVLAAMHVPEEWAQGTLRLSTGRKTSEADINRAVAVIAAAEIRRRLPSTHRVVLVEKNAQHV
jgi:cysteine desulfurase